MRVLELMRIVRNVANLPDFGDEKATREWLVGVIDSAWSIPTKNEEVGDDVVAFLARLAGDKQSFDALYRMLIVCLSTGRALTPEESALAIRLVADAAEGAGVDPQDVLATVQGIAGMVRLLRDAASRSSTY
jgi:hypothetical protein